MTSDNVFRINEVFDSINGEVAGGGQGSVCRFIRFSGCNLNCSYCDTDHESVVHHYAMADLIHCIKMGPLNVTITGGEPLLQLTPTKLNLLLDSLHVEGIQRVFNIETNGTIAPEVFRRNVIYTMDFKMPVSGQFEEMRMSSFIDLRDRDFIKFVCRPEDIGEACMFMEEMRRLRIKANFAVSPILMNRPAVSQIGKGKPLNMQAIHDMAKSLYHNEFARQDGVIFSLQLHKILGVK